MAYRGICNSEDACKNYGREYYCDIKGKMLCCGTQCTKYWWVDYD